MLQSNKDTASTMHFSVQARKLRSVSRPGKVAMILQKMIKSGLHDCAPPPKGDIDSLLSSMEKYEANVMIQVKTFEILVELTANKETANSIALAGGTDLVINAMRKNPEHIDVQELGCELLVNVALAAEAVAEKACKAVSASIGTETQTDFVIENLLKVMETYPDHAEVQETCCESLGKVSMTDNGALSVAKRGGMDVIFDAMERHAGRASIQQHACRVVYHLGLLEAQKQDILKSMADDVGGITLILSALLLHTDDEMVQQHGYEALSILVNDNGVPHKSICDTIRKDHGVVKVLNAMKQYTCNECLQFACLRVILCLSATDAESSLAIANAGIVKLVFAALREHPDCDILQGEGLNALASFSKYSGALRDRTVSEGGIDVAMNAMRLHEREAWVQKAGCRLLNIFCRDALNCALIVAAGGIECVMNAMEVHQNEDEIQTEGAKFLSSTRNTGVSVMSVAAAAA